MCGFAASGERDRPGNLSTETSAAFCLPKRLTPGHSWILGISFRSIVSPFRFEGYLDAISPRGATGLSVLSHGARLYHWQISRKPVKWIDQRASAKLLLTGRLSSTKENSSKNPQSNKSQSMSREILANIPFWADQGIGTRGECSE